MFSSSPLVIPNPQYHPFSLLFCCPRLCLSFYRRRLLDCGVFVASSWIIAFISIDWSSLYVSLHNLIVQISLSHYPNHIFTLYGGGSLIYFVIFMKNKRVVMNQMIAVNLWGTLSSHRFMACIERPFLSGTKITRVLKGFCIRNLS